jgi:hypothetical protein
MGDNKRTTESLQKTRTRRRPRRGKEEQEDVDEETTSKLQ